MGKNVCYTSKYMAKKYNKQAHVDVHVKTNGVVV